jgi:hypothetical protein
MPLTRSNLGGRGGIEPPTQGFSKQDSVAYAKGHGVPSTIFPA